MYGKAVENGESAGLAAIKNVYTLMDGKTKNNGKSSFYELISLERWNYAFDIKWWWMWKSGKREL